MAEILVSYTSQDKEWAFWIGAQLDKFGHTPRLADWEIKAGDDIAAWMEARHQSAQHFLFVISRAYLAAPYSNWERRAALWASATDRSRFALPVLVEDCELPTLLAHLKRCDLHGLDEEEALHRFQAYIAPVPSPTEPMRFPGAGSATQARTIGHPRGPVSSLRPTSFPGGAEQPAATPESVRTEGPHVVLLIHGIRDHALWQSEIKNELSQFGFVPIATNYGWFDLVRFLVPIPFFRNRAIAELEKQVRDIRKHYRNSPISVIAHSFGTYVFARMLRRNFDMVFGRAIFCGSVLSYRFPFEQISDRFITPIINEVGTRDIWPALAESATWGYGSAGTFGFRRFRVEDRWHNGAGHGYFLSAEFCRTYWVPFLHRGDIVPTEPKPEAPLRWLRALQIFRLKYVVTAALLVLMGMVSVTRYCGDDRKYNLGERDDASFFYWDLTMRGLMKAIPSRCSATALLGDDSLAMRFL
jgi:pimeloyl-ACP methyl ester carboxylesterase